LCVKTKLDKYNSTENLTGSRSNSL